VEQRAGTYKIRREYTTADNNRERRLNFNPRSL